MVCKGLLFNQLASGIEPWLRNRDGCDACLCHDTLFQRGCRFNRAHGTPQHLSADKDKPRTRREVLCSDRCGVQKWNHWKSLRCSQVAEDEAGKWLRKSGRNTAFVRVSVPDTRSTKLRNSDSTSEQHNLSRQHNVGRIAHTDIHSRPQARPNTCRRVCFVLVPCLGFLSLALRPDLASLSG